MLHKVIKRFIGTQESKFLKKFYQKAVVETVPETSLFTVKLDKRGISTPGGHKVNVTTRELAQAIANEFNMQEEYLQPAAMPLLSLVRSAIDIQNQQESLRPKMIESLINFIQTDTIKFRDDIEALNKIQYEKLEPVIQYINSALNINMQSTESLFAPPTLNEQEETLVSEYFDQFNDWQLLAFEQCASNLKSTSLSVMLLKNQIDIQKAVELSYIEEDYQIEQHGLVEGSHDLDRNTTVLNISCAKLIYDYNNNKQN